MVLLAFVIKCVSRGPVFFKQTRLGFQGKPFTMYKFRTMKVGVNTGVDEDYFRSLIASQGSMTKLDASLDGRLIPLGGFLRSAGLDELPQFINVILGEMSIVGPRPCTPYEASHFAEWHKKRFAAMPGLTGLWQVRGKNKTSFNQMICLDIYYATTLCFRTDVEIMLRTVQPLSEQVGEFLSTRRGRADRSRPKPVNLPEEPLAKLAMSGKPAK